LDSAGSQRQPACSNILHVCSGYPSYAAELSDASTGKLRYAYITRQTPDALDVTASFGSLAAAREGVRIGTTHLRDQLTKKGCAPPVAPVPALRQSDLFGTGRAVRDAARSNMSGSEWVGTR
jgi:hypothetical protein